MKSLIAKLKDDMRYNRARKQYQQVEKLTRAKAELESDLAFHKVMEQFYRERVNCFDPHKEWWPFAEAKQKQYDHNVDMERLVDRIDEAQAKIRAAKVAVQAGR